MGNIDFTIFTTAFIVGLAGSGHCFSMCGGISATLGLHGKNKLFALNYNLGRILTYVFLGLCAGFVSKLLSDAFSAGRPVGNMIWARRSALIFIFLIGVFQILGLNPFRNLEKIGMKGFGKISGLLKKFLPPQKASDALFVGLLWGFLPCGQVYQAMILGLAQANALMSAGVMLAFGLGTLPALFAITLFSNSLAPLLRKPIFRIILGSLLIAIVIYTWK